MLENACSSLKSVDVERPINLYNILFDTHSPFQKSVFVIVSIISEMYYYYMLKNLKKKMYFCPRMHIFIFTFQFCYLANSL